MKQISSKVEINAPVEVVWKLLTDFNNWKSWNPTVKDVQGEATEGSKLTITMSAKDDCNDMSYSAQVIESKENESFRWRAKMMAGPIFTNDRVFKLESVDGKTILTHNEEYGGIMGRLSFGKLQKFVPHVLEKMNTAIKEKLES